MKLLLNYRQEKKTLSYKLANVMGYYINYSDPKTSAEIILSQLVNSSNVLCMACLNPHSYIMAQSDLAFHTALDSCDYLLPDGIGIVNAARLFGINIQKRVTGYDIFINLSEAISKNDNYKFSYYFLGSTNATLEKIRAKLAIDYPSIEFAGSYSPPYKEYFSNEDNVLMIQAINDAKPDILWVGMTAPKQEKWIYQNRDMLNVKFIGAIGAVFDFSEV